MATNFDAKLETHLKPIHSGLKWINGLMIGLIVVLFLGFAGCFLAATAMLVDAFNSKTTSNVSLRDQIVQQNQIIKEQGEKIDTITIGLKKYGILPR